MWRELNQCKTTVRHDCVFGSDVKYALEFEFVELPDVTVTVANTATTGAGRNLVEQVRSSIRDGFVRVLGPLSLGADVVVRDLVINETDLEMGRYATCTAYELERALDQWRELDPLSPWPHFRRAIVWLMAGVLLYFVGLHPSTPKLISTAALLAATYIMIFKCCLEFSIAVMNHQVKRRVEMEGETK